MEWYVIVFLSVSGAVILYVLGFLMNLAFVGVFARKLRKHNNALRIIMTQKYETVKRLSAILEKNGIAIPPDCVSALQGISVSAFEKADAPEAEVARSLVSYLRQNLVSLASKDPIVQKNEEYRFLYEMINTLERQYRTSAASYNADILGYNYWIRFKPYRYFFLMSDSKQKASIT